MLRATTACTFSTSQLPKVVRTCPSMVCLVHFDFEMCFAHLRTATACTFSTSQLPNVVQEWCVLYILASKCASPHSGVHFFDISTSKSGPDLLCFVHFDFEMCFAPQRRAISLSLLRTRRFSEPTFRPSGATNHWKNTVFRDFAAFSRTSDLLSSETFSFLIFFLLLFSSLL